MSTEFLECPFDRSHQVKAKSFAMHLVKCQRQYPDIKLARCPLNMSHLMKPEDLKEHVLNCPSRAELDIYKYNVATAASSQLTYGPDPADDLVINTCEPERKFNATAKAGRTLQDDEECWDGCTYQAYDPLESCRARKETNETFILPNVNQFVGKSVEAAILQNESANRVTDEQRESVKQESDSDLNSTANSISATPSEASGGSQRYQSGTVPKYHEPSVTPYGGKDYDRPETSSYKVRPRNEYRSAKHVRDRRSYTDDSDISYDRRGSGRDSYRGRYDRYNEGHSSSAPYATSSRRYQTYKNPYSSHNRYFNADDYRERRN